MLRPVIGSFFSALTLSLVLVACGGGAPAASSPPGTDDVCPLLDAGPPPECPPGCVWNGNQCHKHSGVVMPYETTKHPPPPPPPPPPLPPPSH